jgi:hypothetical protein
MLLFAAIYQTFLKQIIAYNVPQKGEVMRYLQLPNFDKKKMPHITMPSKTAQTTDKITIV